MSTPTHLLFPWVCSVSLQKWCHLLTQDESQFLVYHAQDYAREEKAQGVLQNVDACMKHDEKREIERKRQNLTIALDGFFPPRKRERESTILIYLYLNCPE